MPWLWLTGIALAAPDCREDPAACVELGREALKAGDRDGAKAWFREACSDASLGSCTPLLETFDEGHDAVKSALQHCQMDNHRRCAQLAHFLWKQAPEAMRDPPKAYRLYLRACRNGVGWACKDAASMVGLGEGTSRSAPKAVELNRRGCEELGHHWTCVRLARQLVDGRGVAANPTDARALLQHSCDQGEGRACEELGNWLETGRGGVSDPGRALALSVKACVAGRQRACDDVGRQLRAGSPGSKSLAEELSGACRDGRRQACVQVSSLETDGLLPFTPREVARARRTHGWEKSACEQDHLPSCRVLRDTTEDRVVQQQLDAHLALQRSGERLSSTHGPTTSTLSAATQACIEQLVPRYAAVELQGRGTDQPGGFEAAERLAADLAELGFAIERTPVPEHQDASITGTWPGVGALAEEVVVLGAHFDHLGTDEDGVVHAGADDNASGIAGILCIARSLVEHLDPDQDRRTLKVVGFAAEELGFLGSIAWMEAQASPGLAAMVNLDMIGRIDRSRLYVDTDATGWSELLEAPAREAGLELWRSPTPGRSDHVPFSLAGVPALHLSTGVHGDYHRPSDLQESLDPTSATRVTQVGNALTRGLLTRSGPSTLENASCPQPRVSELDVGIQLEIYQRPDEGMWNDVTVRCVPTGSLAEQIGLQPGDLVRTLRVASQWPTEPVHLQVTRDGRCLDLTMGDEPLPCPQARSRDARAQASGGSR